MHHTLQNDKKKTPSDADTVCSDHIGRQLTAPANVLARGMSGMAIQVLAAAWLFRHSTLLR